MSAAATSVVEVPAPGARTDGFDLASLTGLAVLLLAAPLAAGAVAPWARLGVALVAVILGGLWLLGALWRGRLTVARTAAWFFAAAFLGLVALQLVPLPAAVVEAVAPGAGLVRRTLEAPLPASWTIALYPHATRLELWRLAALVIVFAVAVHTLRTRRRAVALTVVLLATGAIQCAVALHTRVAGQQPLFAAADAEAAGPLALTGTYLNKNHFAGLLAMLLPLALGALFALLSRFEARGRSRLLSAMSSPWLLGVIAVAATALAFGAGLLLSLSRAGIFCAVLGVVVLLAGVCVASGFRRQTIWLLLLVGLLLTALIGVATQSVVERLEDVASGRAASWVDRVNLARSGLDMIREQPWLGTGPGSFRHAFERFQSGRFGDRLADYLHNDWLQLACETGVIGLALAAVGLFWLLAATLAAAVRQAEPVARWLALGAASGGCAMLAHSFFDYNLLKITANGVVFAALLALAFALARRPPARGPEPFAPSPVPPAPRHWRLPLGPPVVRAALAIVVLAGVAWAAGDLARRVQAELAINRFVVAAALGPPDQGFVLPLPAPDPIAADAWLERARRLDPDHPGYAFLAGLYAWQQADDLASAAARQRAEQILGLAAAPASGTPSPSSLTVPPPDRLTASPPSPFLPSPPQRLTASPPSPTPGPTTGTAAPDARATLDELTQTLRTGIGDVPGRRERLAAAAAALDLAAAGLPVSAGQRLLAARVAADQAVCLPPGAERDAAAERARRQAGKAAWLAPNKPGILFDAGAILLDSRLDGTGDHPRDRRTAGLDCLRRALAADPYRYAESVYRVAAVVLGPEQHPHLAVTPRTVRAYAQLADILWRQSQWQELLECLDTLDDLAAHQPALDAVSPWLLDPGTPAHAEADLGLRSRPAAGLEFDDRQAQLLPPADQLRAVRLQAAQRRADVLGLLGRWPERTAAVRRARELQRELGRPDLDRVRQDLERKRYDAASTACRELLERDWDNPELLLLAATAAQALDRPSLPPRWDSALDHLLSLVRGDQALAADQWQTVRRILPGIKPRTGADTVTLRFVSAVTEFRAGRRDAARTALAALAADTGDDFRYWPQRHLVWYFLGLSEEQAGNPAAATAAYARALELAPAHLPAARRLHALAPDTPLAAPLADLLAATPLATFGGRLDLLRYTLTPQTEPGTWEIVCTWQILERLHPDYAVAVLCCDDRDNALVRASHRLHSAPELYPLDAPRSGEVFATRYRFSGDLAAVTRLRFDVEPWFTAPVRDPQPPGALVADTGTSYLYAGLESRP